MFLVELFSGLVLLTPFLIISVLLVWQIGKGVDSGLRRIPKAVVPHPRKALKAVVPRPRSIQETGVPEPRSIGKVAGPEPGKTRKAADPEPRKTRRAVVPEPRKNRKVVDPEPRKIFKAVDPGRRLWGNLLASVVGVLCIFVLTALLVAIENDREKFEAYPPSEKGRDRQINSSSLKVDPKHLPPEDQRPPSYRN